MHAPSASMVSNFKFPLPVGPEVATMETAR